MVYIGPKKQHTHTKEEKEEKEKKEEKKKTIFNWSY
jgi:hypothetical protein